MANIEEGEIFLSDIKIEKRPMLAKVKSLWLLLAQVKDCQRLTIIRYLKSYWLRTKFSVK